MGEIVSTAFGIYAEIERLRNENAALRLSVRALTHWAIRLDENQEREPIAELPDGHPYEVVWGGECDETETAFTAGQVKRALELLRDGVSS